MNRYFVVLWDSETTVLPHGRIFYEAREAYAFAEARQGRVVVLDR